MMKTHMKKPIAFFIALLSISCCFSRGLGKTWYLVDIAVVDVIRGKIIPHMTVAITDSMITAIAPRKAFTIAHNAKVINCKGKFLIPGLWDMHVHLGNATHHSLPLFVANGVTGVRDMGTKSFDSILSWRSRIRFGKIVGPHIISPGPILNSGTNLPDFQVAVNSPEEAICVVDSLSRIGVDFIKVHAGLSKETYYAIAKRAVDHQLPFAGHIPASSVSVGLSGEDAAEAGQHSLEHLQGIPFARDTIKAYQHMYPTEESLRHLFAALKKNNTYITPTLSVYHIPADYQAIGKNQDSLLKYLSPELIAFWGSQTGDWPKRNKAFISWMLKARANMIPALQDAGIPLLAGTDTGFPFVLPGFGLHQELLYLVAAGLTPMEALRTATINPADFFGKAHKLGSIEKGKLADMVILNADPLADIGNIRSIETVIVNGKIYTRCSLNDILERLTHTAMSPQ